MKGKLEFVDVLVEILGDNVWLLVFDNYLLNYFLLYNEKLFYGG